MDFENLSAAALLFSNFCFLSFFIVFTASIY
jgi:hypothetical protein